MGAGFSWDTQDRARDIRAAEAAWAKSQELIEACRGPQPRFDLLLFDELNIPLRYDHLSLDEVVAVLKNKPPMLHVVVTGRNAKPELIEAADLVTEMTQVKHPFGSLMTAGAAGIYLIHVFINVGMVVGLLPVIGIPLPFLSYGGSALLANTAMLGIALSLHMRRDDFSIYGY